MEATLGKVPPDPASDRTTYANCMKKVQQRIAAIKWLVETAKQFESQHFILVESIFIQFRKILELIAYASISANKEA